MPSKPRITSFGPLTPLLWRAPHETADAAAAARIMTRMTPVREIDFMAGARSITPGDVRFRVRVIGIDFGAKRVGLALSDATAMLASPWQTVPGGPPAAVAARLAMLIAGLAADSDGLEAIVVGLPRRLDGSDNDQTPVARVLAAELERLTGLPVVLQDERLSSHEADERLARTERDWRKRKTQIDAVAAAIILQDYLDHRS